MNRRAILSVTAVVLLILLVSSSSAFDPLDFDNEYDYVILTHDSLYTQALRLHNHRNVKLRSCIVKTSEVQPAFTGANDIEKIRNFILFAYENWKIAPTYLLLIGDANMLSSDPDNINPSEFNHIPSKLEYNWFDDWYDYRDFANDGWYVNSPNAGELKPIMHLGRLSARNTAQLSNAIDKIIYYDGITGSPAWLGRILMLVGDVNIMHQNGVYRTLNDELFDEEFSDWSPEPVRMYSADYETGDHYGVTTLDTKNAWNHGYGYINGFGNTTSHEILTHMPDFWLRGETQSFAENLDSTNYLPVLFGGTCLVNYFNHELASSDGRCMSEDLLFSTNNRGAIAVIGATHIIDIIESKQLNKLFAHTLLHDGVRNVGRLFSASKGLFLEQAEEGFGWELVAHEFMLMGDPATDLKIHPLPTPTIFANGIEIEDAPILQNTVLEKTAGITEDNTRVVHAEGGVSPLISDRMLKVTMNDAAGSSDHIEWILQEDMNIEIASNMLLYFWMNIVESPGGADKIVIDGNTSDGRIGPRIDIFDQSGVTLNAKWRSPLDPGWQLVYTDLSPLQGHTLYDIRLRYETDSGESGPLTAYIDGIFVGQIIDPAMWTGQEIPNYSMEYDKDENGTPDFWTDLLGVTQTTKVMRRDVTASEGQYSMQVFNNDCHPTNTGAQHIFHANTEIYEYSVAFDHASPDPTTFTFKVIDVETGTDVMNPVVISTDSSWDGYYVSFPNPAYGFPGIPKRLKMQFLPNECAEAIYIDNVLVHEPVYVGVKEPERTAPSGLLPRITSVGPDPAQSGSSVTIGFYLPMRSDVRIHAYNAKGQLVSVSPRAVFPKGTSNFSWNLRPASFQKKLAQGMYFLSLEVNGELLPGSEKITLIR